MKVLILLLLLSPVANAEGLLPACFKSQPNISGDTPPKYFSYVDTFCISNAQWREEGSGVRLEFELSLETNPSESWPPGRRQVGPVQISQLLDKRAMGGGFGWKVHSHQTYGCNNAPADIRLRCRGEFRLRVGGIGTPNLVFVGDSNLSQRYERDTKSRGSWRLNYVP